MKQNLTRIDVVVSEIMPNKNGRRQTDRQTKTGDLFFRTLGIIKRRENMKLVNCSIDSTIISTSLRLGSNKVSL